MKIRKYQNSDRDALKQITIVCFEGVSIDQNIEKLHGIIAEHDWKFRKTLHIEDDIDKYCDGIFVAEVDGIIAGYITTRIDNKTRIGHIPNLAVLPNHRRKGIAEKLIDSAIAHLKEQDMEYARIETLGQNEICKRFYPKRGFREVAINIHYIKKI